MPEVGLKTESIENENTENFSTEDDYYQLKRYLEYKQTMGRVFNNPIRAKALREYIKSKNTIKDDMQKISEDESYAKGLGL